ncbi:hypothetical protein M427DRAFT_138903 [Gonapodya prolifera JEL478]|uniref:ARM repeat-containing protein n=1 Tax=Gonapodya prolifera (strain JEL478) TaxID=1344416 RepID=A0A139A212_GONPJ|nr:hypothetical protein M427DRAFT_138903 [Gonapodya prolifera JEL478]|eukprot:KXS10830.1 hypothetical protein M427DRAFT_138903 [Gonapodya prolifera JEL478]
MDAPDGSPSLSTIEDVAKELKFLGDKSAAAIGSLIDCLPSGSPGEALREKIYEALVEWLASLPQGSDSHPSKSINAVVNLALDRSDTLAPAYLPHLGKQIIDALARPSAHPLLVSLLPRVLFWMSRHKKLPFEGRDETSAKIRDELVARACALDWSKADRSSQWAEAMRDVEMTGAQMERVATKLVQSIPNVPLSSLPPLVYQILLFSKRTSPKPLIPPHLVCRQLAIRRRKELEHYSRSEDDGDDDDDDGDASVVRKRDDVEDRMTQAEGTALLHMGFSLRADKDLSSDFLKNMRSIRVRDLDPFSLALLFIMGRSSRLSEEVNDFLRTLIVSAHKDDDLGKRAPWVSDQDSPETPTSSVDRLTSHLRSLVRLTSRGWDFAVIQSLCTFLLAAIDEAGPARGKDSAQVQRKVIETCTTVMSDVFEHHELIRPYLADETISRIKDGGNSALAFAQILGNLIKTIPDGFFEHIARLQDVLDHLPLIPRKAAHAVILSLSHLLPLRPTLRDHMVLSLRKCLASRDASARLTAVTGLLHLVELSEPRASQGVVGEIALQVEALSAARKAIDAQPEVRVALYSGLESICCRYPRLSGNVLDLIAPQLSKYVYDTKGDAGSALALSKCVMDEQSDQYITEPLPFLLRAVAQAFFFHLTSPPTLRGGHSSGSSKKMDGIRRQLQTLLHNLCKAELADFELDKMVEYSTATRTGTRNMMMAALLFGCYEVMIEYNFKMREHDHTFEDCSKLFKRLAELLEVVKERVSKSKDKDSTPRSKSNIGDTSYFSFGFLSAYVSFAVVGNDPDSAAGTAIRGSQLTHHILGALRKRLHSWESDYSESVGVSGIQEADNLVIVTAALWKDALYNVNQHVQTLENHERSEKKKEKKKPSSPSDTVDTLCDSLKILLNYHPDQLSAVADTLEWIPEEAVDSSAVRQCLNQLQQLLTLVMKVHPTGKEVAAIASLISTLCTSSTDASSATFVEGMCQTTATQDPTLAKTFASLLLTISQEAGTNEDVLKRLLQDLRSVIAIPTDEDDEASSVYYSLVSEATSGAIINAILGHVDETLALSDWATGQAVKIPKDCSDHETGGAFENQTCNILQTQGFVLSSLLHCVVPQGSREPILKTLKRLFVAVVNILRVKNAEKKPEADLPLIGLMEKMGNLSSDVYTFLVTLLVPSEPTGDDEDSGLKRKKAPGGKKKSDPEKLRTMRESKLVPALIFEIERLDKELLKLAKKSKQPGLAKYLKRSTARDFKLEKQKLVVRDDGEGSEDGEESDSADESKQQQSKRKRGT